jgi:hypothetical protein
LVVKDDSLIRYSMSAVIPTLFAAGALGMFFGIRGLRRGTVNPSEA